jgi:methanogenic corrinoid protein MtbC1
MASYSESHALDRICEAESGGGRAFGEERNGWRPDWSGAESGMAQPPADSLLLKVIEGEIIPRLLLAHRGPPTAPPETASVQGKLAAIGDLESFARLVLTSEPGEIVDRVQLLLDGGVRLERIYADLLAPVARLLGLYWSEDRCSFAEVTLGLSRLHRVVHELGRRCRDGAAPAASARHAFFAPSPGEQHTFGLAMLEELFRLAGWQTSSDHGATASTVVRKLTSELLDVVGFSVSCEESLLPLTNLITQTRKTSRNREIVVMVGGRYFTDHPDVAANIGADSVVCGGDDAVNIAEKLVSQTSRNCGKRTLM